MGYAYTWLGFDYVSTWYFFSCRVELKMRLDTVYLTLPFWKLQIAKNI